MYNLHLSTEQLEVRDTIRDFVTREIKPVVLKAQRLEICDRRLPMQLMDQASQMGLRTLALSEDRGGAGADHLTCCIVAEELATGDADVAAALSTTSWLGHLLFDHVMNDAQRERFLLKFVNDGDFHLAFANHETQTDTRLGVNYHRPAPPDVALETVAAKAASGEWIINGVKDYVANAPIAALFTVTVKIPGQPVPKVLLVPADAPGLIVRVHEKPWSHGCCGEVTFKDCRAPADNLLGDDAAALLACFLGNAMPLFQALNVGIGRAAYEAALDFAHLRVQGGRPLIEHQAIGTKLAEIAIRLEVARASVWRAAWASDHPEAIADGSLPDLPLQAVAQIFTSEMMVKATKDAAEIFGAMGVMRDMPLQKYIHDARVCQHNGNGNSDAKLRLAEVIAGFRRSAHLPMALAGE
ncbi:MAG TPA: acyl-CoA dehydrogenase family protein [Pseudolabrys sp.]|jgi:alkylation response protein AidB-like acyl-CoA dehydrogenase|nr:acyl-CoA dehydrogenase family protein [Pseudolabrys sp.]